MDVPWTSLVAVLPVWALAVMLPGPNVMAVVHAAMARSRAAGLWTGLGCNAGTAVWAVASLLGLGVLFQEAVWLYQVVKAVGAAYLAYFGLRLIVAAARGDDSEPLPNGPAAGRPFRTGLTTCLGNPKTAAFFSSLFAVAVPVTAPAWFDALFIGLMLVIQASWFVLLSWTMASGPIAAVYRRIRRGVSAACGAIFVALGVRLGLE